MCSNRMLHDKSPILVRQTSNFREDVAGPFSIMAFRIPCWDVCAAKPVLVPATCLFRKGMVTAVPNLKVAMVQLALFRQFVDPMRGSVLAQSVALFATIAMRRALDDRQ